MVGLALIKTFGLWRDAQKTVWEARQIKRAVELGLGARKREEIELITPLTGENRFFDDLLRRVKEMI